MMNVTESGKIEACCRWVNEINESEYLKFDPIGAAGNIGVPVLRLKEFGGWWALFPLNFCPSCGAKTEVSRREVQ